MGVQSLIGPETVNTLPPATLEAGGRFDAWHRIVDQNLDEAHWVLAEMMNTGLSLHLLATLQQEIS